MDIYEDKKYGRKYIGINIEKSNGNVTDNSTMIDVESGEIIYYYTSNFKYVGKIENGILLRIEEVRDILS